MSDNDKFLTILEKIGEVSERVARIDTRQQIMERDVQQIKREDAEQNRLLAEHIKGVETQAKRLDEEKILRDKQLGTLDGRVSKLEQTPQFLSNVKSIAGWIAAVGGAAVILAKFLKGMF